MIEALPDWPALALFVGASLALLVTPGPAVLYLTARSVEQGTGAGLISLLGITAGGFVHVLAAVLGLSALLAPLPYAFDAIRYLGAAYLVWLGIRSLRRAGPGIQAAGGAVPRPGRRLFLDGLIVNLLNPKAALFFLAFLPQFVDPARGPIWLQMLSLGLLFEALGFLSDGAYVLLAGLAGRRLRALPGLDTVRRLLPAVVFIGLGLFTALEPLRGPAG